MFCRSLALATLLVSMTGGTVSAEAANSSYVMPHEAMPTMTESWPAKRELVEVPAVNVYQHDNSVVKRATSDMSDLALQMEESWFWGDGESGVSSKFDQKSRAKWRQTWLLPTPAVMLLRT